MEPKVNYMVAGLFVVLMGVASLAGVLWLSKSDYGKAYDRYYTYMRESVSGLSVNASVKYRGVEVGRVKEIVLNPDNPEEVRLTLDLVRGTPIKEDTLAVLDVQGLTGLAIVNLKGGSRESPPLVARAGEKHPVMKAGPSLFFRVDAALSRLLADQALSRLLANANGLAEDARIVLDEDNRAALKQTLRDLAGVTHAVATRGKLVDQSVIHAAETMENFAKVSRSMNEQVPAILERVGKSAGALEAMSKEVGRAGTAAGAVMQDARPNIEQFSPQTLTETGLLVAELRQLTASLQRVARQLEREPNSLVLGRAPQPRGPGE